MGRFCCYFYVEQSICQISICKAKYYILLFLVVLYQQKMDKLEETHPYVYSKFLEGLFVIRQTKSYWAGIFSDLCIEQVLMGSIKSVGGLTRGRGFEESTRLVWLLSMPVCGEVHNAVQDVTNLCSQGDNEVHKDLMKARITRDSKDIQCILDFFGERKPFSKDNVDLRSLSSGVIADDSVNVDSAQTIGSTILTSLFGKSVSDHKFSKKDQVIT